MLETINRLLATHATRSTSVGSGRARGRGTPAQDAPCFAEMLAAALREEADRDDERQARVDAMLADSIAVVRANVARRAAQGDALAAWAVAFHDA